MEFFRELITGIRYYLSSLKFIDRHRIIHVIFLPSVISLLIAILVGWWAWETSSELVNYFIVNFHIRPEKGLTNFVVEVLFLMLLRGVVLISFLKVYRYLVLFILSPYLLLVSARVQSEVYEKSIVLSKIRFFRSLKKIYFLTFRNLLIEASLTAVVIMIAIFITWIAPLIPFVLLLVESYFYGYSNLYFRQVLNDQNFRSGLHRINKHSGLIMGNGIAFNILLLVPLVGVLLAPVWSMIAAGLALNQVENKHNYVHNVPQSV